MASDRPETGEMPTCGGTRPGPVGVALAVDSGPSGGVRPVAIRIPSIQVDAEVERRADERDALLAPSTPFVVAWYAATGQLGVPGNVVLSGHARVAGGEPAVFDRLAELQPGGEIELFGEDLVLYRFAVDWNRYVDAAEPAMAEIVGDTDVEAATLISWGGEVDPSGAIPLQRQIVRATRSG